MAMIFADIAAKPTGEKSFSMSYGIEFGRMAATIEWDEVDPMQKV